MTKLPEMCEGCEKKHVIKDDGETCLVYFEPPHIYKTSQECPFNPKQKEKKPEKKTNALKASRRAAKGL